MGGGDHVSLDEMWAFASYPLKKKVLSVNDINIHNHRKNCQASFDNNVGFRADSILNTLMNTNSILISQRGGSISQYYYAIHQRDFN